MLCRLWVCYNPLENFALTQEPISLMSPAHKPHSPSVASGCTPSSVIKSSLCCSGSFPCTCHLEVSPQPALVYPEPGSLSPTLSSPGPLHFLELGSSVKSSSCPKDRVLPEFWFGVAMWFCNWGHPRQKEKGKWNGNTLPTQVTAASLNLPSQSTCFGSLCRGLRELPFFFFLTWVFSCNSDGEGLKWAYATVTELVPPYVTLKQQKNNLEMMQLIQNNWFVNISTLLKDSALPVSQRFTTSKLPCRLCAT